jgi:hypothetical protein
MTMTTRRLGWPRWIALGCMTLAAACSSKDGPAASGADETETQETQGATATDSATSGASDSGASDTTTGDDSTGMDDGGFINPETTSDSGSGDPQPNGAMCGSNAECQSGFCYQIPQVGGVCSECLMDADCEMGTCALDFDALYAVCTDGSLGSMCDSDEGCMGELVCTELIDTGGIFNANYCSSCGPSAPCDGDDICAPIYDADTFSGHFECATPGSVENGGGCPLENGVGDGEVCANGYCEAVDVFSGFVFLGVCGECLEDEHCEETQTCMGGSASESGLTGPTCVD